MREALYEGDFIYLTVSEAIKAEGLAKAYGSVKAVDGIVDRSD